MIRISIPFLFMIYDSSSIPISDFCLCSYFRIFYIFTNLLYTKNLTNLTNLTILQILQPYNLFVDECRTMCRHISYDLLTPGVAAAPRHRMVEIPQRRGTVCSHSKPAETQTGRNPASTQRRVPINPASLRTSILTSTLAHTTIPEPNSMKKPWVTTMCGPGFYYVSSFTLQEPRQQAEQSHGRHAHHHAW